METFTDTHPDFSDGAKWIIVLWPDAGPDHYRHILLYRPADWEELELAVRSALHTKDGSYAQWKDLRWCYAD